jgi:hypothetical protein
MPTPRPVEEAEATRAGSGSPGYSSPTYARALAHVGTAEPLPRAGGWCLLRPIPGTPWRDAAGPYPFLSCAEWSALATDVAALAPVAISAVVVTDPLADVAAERLAAGFPDLCREYKEHFVVDLANSAPASWAPHHRRNAARGRRDTDVEILASPEAWLPDWVRVYDHLIDRHAITGPARFPPESFALQFTIDGLLAARASVGGETVAMTLWFVMGDRAYYHLGAATERGYGLRAMFALFATIIEELARRGVGRLCLGAGAGVHDGSEGLTRFKRGWANRSVPNYVCGRILDPVAYASACDLAGRPRAADYFPAYRRP